MSASSARSAAAPAASPRPSAASVPRLPRQRCRAAEAFEREPGSSVSGTLSAHAVRPDPRRQHEAVAEQPEGGVELPAYSDASPRTLADCPPPIPAKPLPNDPRACTPDNCSSLVGNLARTTKFDAEQYLRANGKFPVANLGCLATTAFVYRCTWGGNACRDAHRGGFAPHRQPTDQSVRSSIL
jgi:hypothetical protein